jgi:flagellar L-ring protein precursor FlgH
MVLQIAGGWRQGKRSAVLFGKTSLGAGPMGVVLASLYLLAMLIPNSLGQAQSWPAQGGSFQTGDSGSHPGMFVPAGSSSSSPLSGGSPWWLSSGEIPPYPSQGGMEGYQGFLAPSGVYRVPPEAYPALTTQGPGPVVVPGGAATHTRGPMLSPEPRGLMLSEASWTYRPPTPPRTVKLHDIIVVVVDEKTQVISEGELDRRKTANAAWTLKDWILLKGLSLIPDPQSKGDPKISGEVEQRFRAEGDFQSRGAMKFRIACEVVDIRPNGTLVLEGRRWLRNNEEIWEISLLGVVRPEDVLPNNTVLSENVASLRVFKREIGHVRDGYRRGWFTRMLDEYQPF